MLLSLLGPSNFHHGKRFGRVGLHSGASSSFGWLSAIDVGRQTDLLKEACPFCDQEEKPYSTSLWAVSSPGRFGFQFSKPCIYLL
jgi:hypothetical protein